MKKYKKKNISIFLVAFVFFFFGMIISQSFFSQKGNKNSLFSEVEEIMEEKYPFEEPTDDEKVYASIEGLVASYHDPHSAFFPPQYSRQFNDDISGEFAGAGMEITMQDSFLVVISPLKDSPAERAGVRAGDIILTIEGEETYGKNLIDLINLMRGKKGTELHIGVKHPGEKKIDNLVITRDIIKIPVLKTDERDEAFIISLYNFNNHAIDEFSAALESFKKSGKKYLLIDLRNNPGGFLTEAIDFLSYFFDENTVLLKEDFGDTGKEELSHTSRGFDLLKGEDEIKVGILINRGSASASEIVAGAFQDYKRGVVIGEKSYGKGSVQEYIQLPQDTSLKVTVSRWLTPHGNQISKKGILPDVIIENMDDKSNDTILEEAIHILKNHTLS